MRHAIKFVFFYYIKDFDKYALYIATPTKDTFSSITVYAPKARLVLRDYHAWRGCYALHVFSYKNTSFMVDKIPTFKLFLKNAFEQYF